MPWRYTWPFQPISSTAPSFTAGSTTVFDSTTNALESTGREWGLKVTRSVRLSEKNNNDFYAVFGTSDITAARGTTPLILGGTVETFQLQPRWTHIAIIADSTTAGAEVNVTLGVGE